MARIFVDDYIDIATKGYHNASSYQVALDAEFTMIIDESINDKVNVVSWNTPLLKPEGGAYADLSNLYARIKVHIDNTESPWFVIATPGNQNDQTVIATDVNGDIETYNSLEIGLN